MILPVKPSKTENGSAVLFSVTGSLIALALAFILMLSTTQTLNLAFFNNNDLKLSSTVETGTNTAVALINSGYDFTQHDSTNPYISERTINDDGTPQVVEKISWHVEPVNLTNDTFCTDSFNTYTPGEMEVVVVGGGGSGGGSIGGGGGAGGFIEQTVQLEAGEYTINVGAGGASAQPEEAGETGEDSTAFGLTALGGGGGAAVIGDPSANNIVATGGTVTEYESDGTTYRVHSFTETGTSNFNVSSAPSEASVDYLIVGGGGGGGDLGGGGGAGGFREGSLIVSNQNYSVTVGNGGARGNPGANGGNSSFANLVALGGGGAGSFRNKQGLAGGSGGGAGRDAAAGTAGGLGTTGQGNNGGNAPSPATGWVPGGGGGGAEEPGSSGISNGTDSGERGGKGGDGILSSISGTPTYYAGGGGGANGGTSSEFARGGLGGGGNGAANGVQASPGLPNTGGGGGGDRGGPTGPGSGGSGVVIIKYPISASSVEQIISPTLGGSGGGATINDIAGTTQQSGALGAAGQGNPGGDSHATPSSSAAAAGGGGAATSGSDGALNTGGDGGAGVASTITGTETFYAAGGGGAAPESQTQGAGGSNIGGTGSAGTNASTDGEKNTGSGGGGNYSLTTGESGEGGSGIVIVRYPTQIGETTIPALALGGTVEEVEISDTTYRVHSFTETGESTFNLITTGDSKYNCGYTLTVTAEMPLYSDTAKMTAQTTLTPFQYGEASTGDVITYNPTQTSLLRNGIHANGNLTFSQNSKLYSYYSNDDYTNSSVLISPSSNLNAASLSSGEQITVNSTNISEATIANTTLYNVSGSDINSYINAGCVINSVDCSETVKNIQNYKISDTTHNQWVEQQCGNPETSFSSTQTIPKGVTCVETSNITLGSNFVEGDYETPSILIVKGNLNFDSDITLNPAKAPRTLQIYVQGNITNTEAANSNSTINATLVATGTNGNILLEETNTDSDITFNGATYSSGNTEFKGNITVWQDLNLKFTRNVDDFTVYQKGGRETTEYVREQFNISNPGGAFGDTWNPDTQPGNINPAQQGGG